MDIPILGLEASVFAFQRHSLLDECLFAVLLDNSATEVLCRTLNDGSDLRELRRFRLATFLLVVSLGVQHRPHSEQLKIPLELWCQLCLRQVKPLRSCGGLVLEGVDSQHTEITTMHTGSF